ncbi:MAG: glycosyltransferase family 10 [Syntrophales bacterium]|jgi:hypothetical protein|nr:glycosyltransferase family 10 [Syntrophales bacterium]MDY0044772.1 glycosyltransferase family 10 [Syntrophales bacterium]
MLTVRIVKDWDWPDLMRQTSREEGIWQQIYFTEKPYECDYVIVLNNRMKVPTKVSCPPANIWALMQEPYHKGFTDWMIENHAVFSKVFTHYRYKYNDSRYIPSQPALPWQVNKTYDELKVSSIPEKSKPLSWIVGDAMDLPGHKKRRLFLEYIRNNRFSDIDLYGKKINFIEDKWNGLAPYNYSLAVENTSGPDYWTEKLADCFLAWTIPFYYGCTNLEHYFPKDSFIRIDIEKPEESLALIQHVLKEDIWERRIPALKKARQLVLEHYQFFPYMAGLISREKAADPERKHVIIPAYRRSLKAAVNYLIYKLYHACTYQKK